MYITSFLMLQKGLKHRINSYPGFVNLRYFIAITKIRVNMETNFRVLTRYIYYAVGQDRKSSLLFRCLLYILWAQIIFWHVDPLLGNASVNIFPRQRIRRQQSDHFVAMQRSCKYKNRTGVTRGVFYVLRVLSLIGNGYDPTSRRRRRKGKSQIWESKIWSLIPRYSDPRKTALARTSSMYKWQTHPLVREGAPQETRP
jgi:hypothetical protein